MWKAALDEAQAGIKIAGRNINNLGYGRKWRGTKEPLEVKEKNEKADLKLNIQKTKIMASSPISSVQLLSRVRLFATP